MAALGQMQGATAMGEQVSTDYANRWLNQWGQKIASQDLMLKGQLGALGALQTASGIEQQQFGNVWNMGNLPSQMGGGFLGNVNAQALQEFGTHVAAYGGAGSSSSWNQSEGSTPGSYSTPLWGIGGSWST
jgi:hypothetical protein